MTSQLSHLEASARSASGGGRVSQWGSCVLPVARWRVLLVVRGPPNLAPKSKSNLKINHRPRQRHDRCFLYFPKLLSRFLHSMESVLIDHCPMVFSVKTCVVVVWEVGFFVRNLKTQPPNPVHFLERRAKSRFQMHDMRPSLTSCYALQNWQAYIRG